MRNSLFKSLSAYHLANWPPNVSNKSLNIRFFQNMVGNILELLISALCLVLLPLCLLSLTQNFYFIHFSILIFNFSRLSGAFQDLILIITCDFDCELLSKHQLKLFHAPTKRRSSCHFLQLPPSCILHHLDNRLISNLTHNY